MRPILLLLALVLALPAAADAATVTSYVQPGECPAKAPCSPDVLHVTFEAAPGEVNRLTVSAVGDRSVVFEDPAARIDPGPSCAARDEHAVVCSGNLAVHARLGDGDDTASTGRYADVDGGDGDDRLTAGAGG